MKRIIILAMLISCIACNKKDNTNPSGSNGSNTTDQWGENVMTILDNGKTYKIESDAVGCQNFNDFDGVSCFLEVNDTYPNVHEIMLYLHGEMKGSERVGAYVYHRDPKENFPSYYYIIKGDTEDDDIFWGVDSSIINIASSVRKEDYSDYIRDKGTFKAWVSRVDGNKTINSIITGEFDCW